MFILQKIITLCLGKYLWMLLYLFMFMWHNLMRWCFWFNLGRKICKARCWDVTYTYNVTYCYLRNVFTLGCYLHVQRKKLDLLDFTYCTCTKKKAGLVVWFYLHAHRKKLDLLDVIYIYNIQRKKLDLLDVIYITKKKAGLVQVM